MSGNATGVGVVGPCMKHSNKQMLDDLAVAGDGGWHGTARVELEAIVACPAFRLMPGMRSTAGLLCVSVLKDGSLRWVDDYGDRVQWSDTDGDVPDLDDPATQGCFEALNVEAWEPIGEGRRVEIEVVARCRYEGVPDEKFTPLFAVRVIVLCDTWREAWLTPRDEWQETRGLALALALLASPKGRGL